MSKESLFREAAKRRLDATIHASRACVAGRADVVAAYDQLLHCVRSRSGILARRARCGERLDVNKALLAMALHHADWLAPVETWQPSGEPAWRELGSLATHLFARFPMPRFMTTVWLEGEPGQRVPQHEWYKRLGRGENIRRLGLPMPITRAMAHRFAQAPDHLTAVAALRWAQVHALGGSDALARSLLDTRLGRALENEDFWETVVHFFVNHPELEPAQIGPIIDFLQQQKVGREGVSADGTFGLLPPPQPHFTMKGRTPAALLRLVAAWHGQLATSAIAQRTWPRSDIGELRWIEKVATATAAGETRVEARVWTISELCSSGALFVEGQDMRHCVASYIHECVQRRTTIWSMQLETRQGLRRVLTIELDPFTRRIRQARRRYNAPPKDSEREVLARWAAREGLALSELRD